MVRESRYEKINYPHRIYRVKATTVPGKANRLYTCGDIVNEYHFAVGQSEKLADQGYLERLFDPNMEFYRGSKQHLDNIFSHCRASISKEEIAHVYSKASKSIIGSSNPIMSCILPLFRSKEIAFVVMESLCRQQNAPDWELVVIEEDFDSPLTLKGVEKYSHRLRMAGCGKITYISIDQWMPLSAKWHYLIQNCSDTSKIVCFNSADVYCPPNRLEKQFSVLTSGYNWYRISSNIVYDIETRLHYKRESIGQNKGDTVCRATTMDIARKLPLQPVKRSVDGWTFNTFRVYGLIQFTDSSEIGNLSVNVNGINNISLDRQKRIMEMENCCDDMCNHLPEDIVKMLEKKQAKIEAHKQLIKNSTVKI